MRPLSGIDQVGMAIDQPGHDPAAVESDAMPCVPAGWKVGRRASKGDPPVLGRDGAALNDAEPRPVGRKRRKTCIEPNLVELHGVVTRSRRSVKFLYLLAQGRLLSSYIGPQQTLAGEGNAICDASSFLIMLCCHPAGRTTFGSLWPTSLSPRSRKARPAPALVTLPASPFPVFPTSIATPSSAAWPGWLNAVVQP